MSPYFLACLLAGISACYILLFLAQDMNEEAILLFTYWII